MHICRGSPLLYRDVPLPFAKCHLTASDSSISLDTIANVSAKAGMSDFIDLDFPRVSTIGFIEKPPWLMGPADRGGTEATEGHPGPKNTC